MAPRGSCINLDIQGSRQTLVPAALRQRENCVERLILSSGSRKAEGRRVGKTGACVGLRYAEPETEKVHGAIRDTDAGKVAAKAETAPLVWGPGAGAEGGREALFWP
jgi:hypothetical protein